VALSQKVSLEGSLDVWLLLRKDSHGPLQLVLDGLVDLDDLSWLKSFLTLSFQLDGWINGWMDRWLRLGKDSQLPHQLDLVGLVDLTL
jgi:hypothetical protein